MPLLRALALFSLLLCQSAFAQDRPAAGTIDFVEGDAMVEAKEQKPRAAKLGEPVYASETVTTLAGAELHLKMADGGYLSLRENTKITLTEYVANGGDEDRSLIDLAKGTFRSVTGWIGKYRRSAYAVRTPMVTMGVRGTDHEPAHFEPGDPRGAPGSYDKVNEGSTVMQSKFGTVTVQPNRAAHFHSDQRSAPRMLQSVPTFFRPTKNEQRFTQRAQASVKTIDTQRTQRRQVVVQQKKATEKKALEKKQLQKKQAVEKKQQRFEKKQEQRAEKKQPQRVEKKQQPHLEKKQPPRLEKKAAPAKDAGHRFEKKKK